MPSLPQNKIWSQVSHQDTFSPTQFGNLFATIGIDLSDNHGAIRLGKRMVINTGSDDLATLTGAPVGFWRYGGAIYTAGGTQTAGYSFVNDGTIFGTFSQVTGSNTPSNFDSTINDGNIFYNALYVSDTTGGNVVLRKNSVGTWTTVTIGAYVSGTTNMLCTFIGRQYITFGQSKIYSLNSSDTVVTSGVNTLDLTFTQSPLITKLLPGPDRIWVLTLNVNGGKGVIYQWDGVNTTYTSSNSNILEAAGALSGVMLNDVPYIMDTDGNLQSWNGGAFVTVASLNRKRYKKLYNVLSNVNNRFIHPNGMAVVDGKIQVLVDTRNYELNFYTEDTMPAGIYEFDPKYPTKGLVHKQPFGLSKAASTITDYGQLKINMAGGIQQINTQSLSASNNGSFLAGIGYYSDSVTVKYGIYYDDLNDTLQKAGSFITLKFDSQALKDSWPDTYLIYKKLAASTDRIIAKYRIDGTHPVEAIINWTGSSTFIVNNSDINVSTYWTEGTGGEVEILQGVGGGMCAHITNAVLVSGVWTVTLDETFAGAVGTSIARFSNWIKINTALFSQNETVLKSGAGAQGTHASQIQYKYFAIWSGRNEIQRLLTNNTKFQNA